MAVFEAGRWKCSCLYRRRSEDFKSEAGIVNLAEARVRLRSRLGTHPSRAVLLSELGAAQLLLDGTNLRTS